MSMLGSLGSPASALRILSMMMGVFLVSMGLTKIDWLMDGGILAGMLQDWRGTARPLARWYLDTVAIPGAPVFARVVLLAELAAGAALLLGVRVRLTASRRWVACSRLRLPEHGCPSASPASSLPPDLPGPPAHRTHRAGSARARASRRSMGGVVPGPAGIRARAAGAAPVGAIPVGVR